jgi:hypothetical protein
MPVHGIAAHLGGDHQGDMQAASSQWNRRVGRSQMRVVALLMDFNVCGCRQSPGSPRKKCGFALNGGTAILGRRHLVPRLRFPTTKKKTMKKIFPHCWWLPAALLAAACLGPVRQGEDAIKYRQSALSVMGTHFGRLGAMANGKAL